MKQADVIKEAMGLPFALCDQCAPLYTAAFSLKKLNGPPAQMVTCANCRRKKPGAKYERERTKP